MMKLLSGCALSLLVAAPAWAMAPHCSGQLASIKGYLAEETAVPRGTTATYDEARHLCRAGHEMRAQDLARDLRERLSQSLSHATAIDDAAQGG